MLKRKWNCATNVFFSIFLWTNGANTRHLRMESKINKCLEKGERRKKNTRELLTVLFSITSQIKRKRRSCISSPVFSHSPFSSLVLSPFTLLSLAYPFLHSLFPFSSSLPLSSFPFTISSLAYHFIPSSPSRPPIPSPLPLSPFTLPISIQVFPRWKLASVTVRRTKRRKYTRVILKK